MDYRALPAPIVPFITQQEAPVKRVYDDKNPSKILQPGDAVEGKLTAGVGHTGADLSIGLVVTDAMVDAWLDADLDKARTRLYDSIGAVVEDLTDNQYAAMLSFVFNLGDEPGWNIWKVLKARKFDSVPSEIVKFVYWNGLKSNGLVRRRNAEVELWSTGEPGTHTDDTPPPSSVTRDCATPPAPTATPSLGKQPGFIGAAVTAASAGATAAVPIVQSVTAGLSQVQTTVEPLADKSPFVGHIYQIVIGAIATLSILILGLMWLKNRKDTRMPQDPHAK